jgi:histidine phosphotransferase ChpT
MAIQVDLSILELVCSRLCHDMVGPVGAATNGIELLRELSTPQTDDIIDMTDASARIAWRRLEFFRVAFGYAGGRGGWGTGELGKLAGGMLNDSRVKLDWRAAGDVPELHGRGGKLVLNLLLLMAEAMPRGGALVVRIARAGEDVAVTMTGEGPNAMMHPRVANTAQGKIPPGELDSRVVLAHLAYLQIGDAGAAVKWSMDEDRVAVAITLPQAAQAMAAAAE